MDGLAKAIARLKDIAEKTGFSTNTVSLALRESPRIPEETRSVIRSVAIELNYLPNHIAKSLVSRETRTIGLVLTDIMNPTLTQTAQAVEIALAERGYGTLFATSNNTLSEEIKVVEMFRSRQVDGLLIYPSRHQDFEYLRPLRRANFPIVLLIADPNAGIDGVSVNDRSGGLKATRHLIGLGHRGIGFLDASHPNGNDEKLEGYQQALSQAGIPPVPALVVPTNGHYATHGYFAMDNLMSLPNRPTAVFSDNDSIALGALRWCHKHGVRVPADLAIMGYDNIEFTEFAEPPLSTVNYDVDTVSRMAVDRVLRLIGAGDQLPEPRVTLIDPELVIREST
ncbi:MAG: LacI family DNA-binding transcriptional regulator [Devosia sp.]